MLLNNYTQQAYKSHHVIIPRTENTGALLLGDLNAATDEELIKEFNIKTIITAACGLEHLKILSTLTHIVFPLMDTKQENIETYFQLSYRTIEQNLKRGAVLVHCGAGISRSASLVIAFYMKKYNSTFKNAISYIKKIKPNVCPNLGFQLQLKNYQNQLDGDKQILNPPKVKTVKIQRKNVSVTSPYTFQIPLQNQNGHGGRNNSRIINRSFNKTHGNKIHKKVQNKGELFIQGKTAVQRQHEIQNNFSAYEPQKYSRKYAEIQRMTVSTAKKGSSGNSRPSYKF